MKILTILFMTFLSGSASAASLSWENLERGEQVQLSQNIELLRKSGEAIHLPVETKLFLDDVQPLGELSVTDFTFRVTSCTTPELDSEMSLILPNENTPNSKAEVGVSYTKGCELDVFVESKDIATSSFTHL
jgi:hypothetical protein